MHKNLKNIPVFGGGQSKRFFLDMFDELSDFGSCVSSIFSFGAQPNYLARLVDNSGEGQIDKND